MTNETFESIKGEILKRATSAGSGIHCSGYRKAAATKNEKDLLDTIFENASWCLQNKVIDLEFMSRFTTEFFVASGLANAGKENTGLANSGDRNSGNWNSGDWNSGDRNSGDRNSGNWNSGDRNSGDSNSGYRNSGDSNSGYRNSGDSNSGDRNSGDSNSGYRNSGDRNSGNWNSGDRNSGDSNSGYRNSGAFCADPDPIMWLFDKPCKKMTVRQWEQSKACQLMYAINPTIWIPWSSMTKEEQEKNPKLEASEGYTKKIPMKEAWANTWHNWTEEIRNEFKLLENFNPDIFEKITGIKV